MKFLRESLVLAATVAVAACSDPSGPKGPPALITALPRQLTSVEQEMIGSTNRFGAELLKQVNAAFADSNVFLSPLSASMALGMTMNGAEGETFTQMRTALGFGARTYEELNTAYQSLIALLRGLDPRVEFRIANAIYYHNGFASAIEPDFLADARTYFDASTGGLDFGTQAALDTVNGWANRNTNGKIPKILDSMSADLVMLLMNAIYFKGDWRAAFKTTDTRPLPFTTHDGVEVQVQTMYRKGGFRLGDMGGAQVVELPYGGDAFVMTILLPPAGTPINQFVATLTPDIWQQADSNLDDSDLELYFPKFKLAWEDTLNDELQRMGMVRAFQGGNAQFTRISRTRGDDLYISFVKQKAFVDVNEVGTEAAAVTVVGVDVVSLPPVVRIDRPFVFALRERLSGTVLFMGKIVEPKY